MPAILRSAPGAATRLPALLGFLAGCVAALASPSLFAADAKPTPPPPPAVAGGTPGAEQILRWWSEGTAAGNVGDFYDNRDGNHAPVDLGPHPQVKRWSYSPEEIQRNENRGPNLRPRPAVIVGNASLAGSPPTGSSIGRLLYSLSANSALDGLQLLEAQYRANNLFIYPEHLDHDPVLDRGWGDLFPVNTPYLLVSQGSSGTDRPFATAAFATLAALRPETKRTLTQQGLLMPTLQMLLRLTQQHVKNPNDYFTGRTHPSVFASASIDAAKMVTLAHNILPDSIPPLAQLKVVSEDTARPGVDFFHVQPAPATPERLGDSSAAIARIWRNVNGTRRIVVSGDASFDANQRPLTFRWAILRGDPARTVIRPLNASTSVVEITFAWSGRTPISPGSRMDSSRQDVALFVSNGTWWSAPAFVTCYGSDRELRTYAPDGRLLDVGYFAGGPQFVVDNGARLTDWIAAAKPDATARTVRALAEAPAGTTSPLTAAIAQFQSKVDARTATSSRLQAAQRTAEQLKTRLDGAPAAESGSLNAEATRAATEVAAARQASDAADAAVQEARNALANAVVSSFRQWIHEPRFAERAGKLLSAHPESQQGVIANARKRLVAFGLVQGRDPWRFSSAFPGGEFTRCEQNLLAEFHVELLAWIVKAPGIHLSWRPHYQDPSIFPERPWRDLYRHDAAGRTVGWTRLRASRKEEFSADGYLVRSRDRQDRVQKAVAVDYVLGSAATGSTLRPLETRATPRTFTYRYEDASDLRGQPIQDP